MAKRFTDTEKWKKPFIRTMKAPYKLLWLYILDECDHAGIWEVDFEVAEIKIGERLNIDFARQSFFGKIIEVNNKWFLPDFIEFQYGELNVLNRAHKSAIEILQRNNLMDSDLKYLFPLKKEVKPLTSPLQAPSQGAMDKDKDKDKELDKDKEGQKKTIIPEEIKPQITAWLDMRRGIKKPATDYALRLAMKELEKLAPGDFEKQIEIINQSIIRSYTDFYPLKSTKNGNHNTAPAIKTGTTYSGLE